MIINVKYHHAQKNYVCHACSTIIYKGERYFRLYGMAEDETPWDYICHGKCIEHVRKSADNKKLYEFILNSGLFDFDYKKISRFENLENVRPKIPA